MDVVNTEYKALFPHCPEHVHLTCNKINHRSVKFALLLDFTRRDTITSEGESQFMQLRQRLWQIRISS